MTWRHLYNLPWNSVKINKLKASREEGLILLVSSNLAPADYSFEWQIPKGISWEERPVPVTFQSSFPLLKRRRINNHIVSRLLLNILSFQVQFLWISIIYNNEKYRAFEYLKKIHYLLFLAFLVNIKMFLTFALVWVKFF